MACNFSKCTRSVENEKVLCSLPTPFKTWYRDRRNQMFTSPLPFGTQQTGSSNKNPPPSQTHAIVLLAWIAARVFPSPCLVGTALHLREQLRVQELHGGLHVLQLLCSEWPRKKPRSGSRDLNKKTHGNIKETHHGMAQPGVSQNGLRPPLYDFEGEPKEVHRVVGGRFENHPLRTHSRLAALSRSLTSLSSWPVRVKPLELRRAENTGSNFNPRENMHTCGPKMMFRTTP